MTEQTTQNPLGMKDLKEAGTLSWNEQLGDISKKIFTWDWIFSNPFEKAIVFGSILWTMYCVGKFMVGLV